MPFVSVCAVRIHQHQRFSEFSDKGKLCTKSCGAVPRFWSHFTRCCRPDKFQAVPTPADIGWHGPRVDHPTAFPFPDLSARSLHKLRYLPCELCCHHWMTFCKMYSARRRLWLVWLSDSVTHEEFNLDKIWQDALESFESFDTILIRTECWRLKDAWYLMIESHSWLSQSAHQKTNKYSYLYLDILRLMWSSAFYTKSCSNLQCWSCTSLPLRGTLEKGSKASHMRRRHISSYIITYPLEKKLMRKW